MGTKNLANILLIVLLNTSLGVASADTRISEVSEVWGRVVKVDQAKIIHGHTYFIYYTVFDQQYAYPIVAKNKEQKELVDQVKNKLAKVSGSVYSTEIVNDGIPMSMMYFVPENITPLSLDTLNLESRALTKAQNPAMTSTLRSSQGPEGGIRISDDAAEVSVYTAAALLLGNILKDYLINK